MGDQSASLTAVDRDHINGIQLLLASLREKGNGASIRRPRERTYIDLARYKWPAGSRLAIDHMEFAPCGAVLVLDWISLYLFAVGNPAGVGRNLGRCDSGQSSDIQGSEGLVAFGGVDWLHGEYSRRRGRQ